MYRVLVLYATPDIHRERLTTQQHLAAVSRLSEPAEVLAYNADRGAPAWLRRLRFDAVVLHTTLLCYRWTESFATWRRGLDWLADQPTLKIAFPQDEYDHAHVLDEWLDALGVSVVCTTLDGAHRSVLYPKLSDTATFYEVLTGYIDETSARSFRGLVPDSSDRTHDLVYRASRLPYWFGSHGQSKHLIGQEVVARASRHALSYDISTRPEDTILGDAWLDFLRSGRATIGTESGSSVLDARGEIQSRIREVLRNEPGLSFDEVSRRMPSGWDRYRFVAISPRHLEAVATRTAQILVRGRYSGVLEAGRHYVAVEPDFSNLDEALEQLREPGLAELIAEQAYEDVYMSGRWEFGELTRTLTRIVREHSQTASGGRGVAFSLGAPVARAHKRIEENLIAPVKYVLRTGRGSAALLKLVVTERAVRGLFASYLASGSTRGQVGPRDAVVDLLCVSRLRRASSCTTREDMGFGVEVTLDRSAHHVTFRSALDRRPVNGFSLSDDEVGTLLSEHVWGFTWDHSEVGTQAYYPILGDLSTPLYLHAGARDLETLSWLARDRPHDVAMALAPVFRADGGVRPPRQDR